MKVVKGSVIVMVDRRLLGRAKIIPAMSKVDPAVETIFVIVGGGAYELFSYYFLSINKMYFPFFSIFFVTF